MLFSIKVPPLLAVLPLLPRCFPDSHPGGSPHGLYTFSLCLLGFCPGTPAPSHGAKTSSLDWLTTPNTLMMWVWIDCLLVRLNKMATHLGWSPAFTKDNWDRIQHSVNTGWVKKRWYGRMWLLARWRRKKKKRHLANFAALALQFAGDGDMLNNAHHSDA